MKTFTQFLEALTLAIRNNKLHFRNELDTDSDLGMFSLFDIAK